MKKSVWIAAAIVLAFVSMSYASPIDNLLKGLPQSDKSNTSEDKTTVSGLKEALSIGTGKAVGSVSKMDGYFGNEAIKILLPEKLRMVGNVLGKLGYQGQVDEFVLTMNRAAENAAPKAKKIFISAVKEMTFSDARKILKGGDTAATDYFRDKTSGRIAEAFKPTVSASMNKVGTARAYKAMTEKYLAVAPFAKAESLDLDRYVTDKAVEGLFYMLGQEEKKIRTDPAARVTELLRTVFGK